MLKCFLINNSKLKNSCKLSLVRIRIINRNRHDKNSSDYLRSYEILNLPPDADQESVRKAFINLCKQYHPDSNYPAASSEKFQEIENAYRILQNKFANERWNIDEDIGEYGLYYEKKDSEEVKIFDIKHKAPQHRQYLTFEGIGSGAPSQREKQYAVYKTLSASENVFNHRIKKISEKSFSGKEILPVKDKKEAKKFQTRYGIDRLVEDLIQESIARGELNNLKGAGKPLAESNYNPYVDFVTHKMNQIMIENGFMPEWINLQKEIAEDVENITKMLLEERKSYGAPPINDIEKKIWNDFLEEVSEKVKIVNHKIDKYNLVVPILDKQMLQFNLDKESEKVLETGEYSKNHKLKRKRKVETTEKNDSENTGFFSFF